MGVLITRAAGQLKRITPTDDAVICMVLSGVAVSGKIALSECKQIFSSDALEDLGITSANNPLAFKDISDYYLAAGEGAELNFMLVADSTSMMNICDRTLDLGKKLLESTEGRAVVFIVNRKTPSGYTPTIVNGMDDDVRLAMNKFVAMAKDYDTRNIPIVGILPGLGFAKATIGNMVERSTLLNDYGAINMYCENNDGLVSQGLIAGWIAKHQVHENIGRVASGKVSDTAFFPDGTPAKDLFNSLTALNGKGIIFPVKIGNKSGYYFNDDACNTTNSSDYSSISWNRTINKAKRIAYATLIEKLNDSVEIDPATGLMESTVASDWESDVENAIKAQMMTTNATKKKEISGVKCTVDPNSDIANDEVTATINIVRKGQSKNISVLIGYVSSI